MHAIEFFDRGVNVNPNGVAFVAHDGTGALTYREAEAITHRVAAALQRDGVAPGTPVGVLSANSPLVMPCILGVLRAGCTWVSLNARSATGELGGLLDTVGAPILLHSAELADVAERLCSEVPGLQRLVTMDGPDGGPAAGGWLAPEDSRVPLPPHDPEAVAAYFGTGGTTGEPKAVEVTHRSLETMIHAFNCHMPETDPVHLVAAPLTHAAGTAVFPVLSVGGRNVIHPGVDAGEILRSIERNRVTRLFLPPTAIYALLDHPEVFRRDTSTLRYFLYGAAPMSVSRLKQALRTFGPVMAQFYGQVEVPMFCTFFSPAEHVEAMEEPTLARRLASCGRPSMVATVAVMVDGKPVDRGERGEIVVRSSLRMRGYHRDPVRTAATLLPGGWHATGDIGYLDDDGYLFIVDRKRDLIISGGFNVFPGEVEQVLWGHHTVADCAVVGLPDKKWGERVTAFVELKEGAEADAAALIDLCRERLGSVKAPKAVVFRTLPRSPAGKVLKRTLRDEFWQGRERRV
ncbi:AMP-binding protein [Yinghuangia aomiensis]|uniref:AMP-binding protein n=1 Tax=Yinghuangia aomiensis TaxID=676205 RepID=A0ABP9HU87_9ACTN